MSLQTGSIDADGLARTTDGKLYVTLGSGSTIPTPTFTGAISFDATTFMPTIVPFAGVTASFPALRRSSAVLECILADASAYATFQAGILGAVRGTATTAGGATAFTLGSSQIQVAFGSGAPTLSAPQGSLYMRTDGSSTSTRAYINTNGTTGWTAITTAA